MPNKYELTIINNEDTIGTITETGLEKLYKLYKKEYPEYCNISYYKFKNVLKNISEDNQIIELNFKCKLIKTKNKTNSEMVVNNRKKKNIYLKYLVNYLKDNNIPFTKFRDFKIPE